MTMNSKPNRLSKEKSPYLLQHQYNPVDWFPWSDEAFEKAKQESKPIFLSIGYSTCHWCHVMAHESFEDEEVAELLNRDFVAVKVDREERPDVDHLYMSVCQALTGQGGWPLTIVMTPDKKPFFAGTYFPKRAKYGRIGLVELLNQLSDKWRDDRDRVISIGQQIIEGTAGQMVQETRGEVSLSTCNQAFEMYSRMFDETYGGFGSAPKFPSPHNLSFLLRYHKRSGNTKALDMVEKTLDAMYRGGLHDHIGFGFARYSTDARWLVPHFEKMLYDNALLAIAYIESFQVTGKQQYADVAERIFEYVLRDMTDEGGTFYCAEDADSEGVEGKFYVWTPQEIDEVLGTQDGELFCSIYDITVEGNFEGESIPNLIEADIEKIAEEAGVSIEQLLHKLEALRAKLFTHRERRIHPHKDDKILTSWNGLMIAALAKAANALNQPKYGKAAERAVQFMMSAMRRKDGRLLARYREGEAGLLGYLDDYAFLIWGLIELYEATFDITYLREALKLNEDMLRLFRDKEAGGLYFTGSDGEALFARPKETYDGAIPSGNSVAALNMLKLARLTYDAQLSQAADEHLAAIAGAAAGYPAGHAMLLMAIEFACGEPSEIVIAGAADSPQTAAMLALTRSAFLPNALRVLNPPGEAGRETRELIPLAADKTDIRGQPTAYVCEGFACQSPTTDLGELAGLLNQI